MVEATASKRSLGSFVVIGVGALLLYQLAFYWTHRSGIDSYGLGPVEFPESVAGPFFTPARLLDERVLGFEPHVDRTMSKLLH